jgi:transposase
VLSLRQSTRVWIAAEPVHMGKGHDGLASLVKQQFGEDPFSGNLYVFLGKRSDRCKILWWEAGGFVVFYKRLDRGRMRPPRALGDARRVVLDGSQLALLLDGVDVSRVQRPVHWKPSSARRGIDSGTAT